MTDAAVRACDCSDHQLDAVGCDCGGEPRPRATLAERLAEQDRVGNALIERALDREHRAEAAHWEAERLADAARGWAWDPDWGDQPMDEHVRALLAHREATNPARLAA